MRNINKTFLSIVLTIIIVLILLAVVILKIQEPSFFHPWHDEESYNKLLNDEQFENVKIENNKEVLNGWIRYNVNKEKSPLVIFFGGNAQNSSNTCMNFKNNDTYKYFEGYNLMIVDYPGYGLSSGTPSDKTMFEAALNVYDYANNLEYVDNRNIIIMGYSIGTGVATYLSAQREVNGLILVAPYDRALSLYNNNLNIFYGPIKLLAKYKFDSMKYAQSVKVDPLIITSYDDEVINYKLSLNLEKYFQNVNKTIILDNVKHNEYFAQESVLISINNYLKEKM